MAPCPKCSRTLPANGSCLYCGKLDSEGAWKKPGRSMGRWLRGFIKLAVAAGLVAAAYWLIFTEDGHAAVQSIRKAIGLRSGDATASEWVQPLMKHTRIKELIESGFQVNEEVLSDDSTVRLITIMRRDGSDLIQYAWKVNKDTGDVIPMSSDSAALMN